MSESSFPIERPEPTERMTPIDLMSKTNGSRNLRMMNPLRIVFISKTPDPDAAL